MWKVFTLALLATAAANPAQTKDDLLQTHLVSKLNTFDKAGNLKGILDCNKYGPKDATTKIEESLTNIRNGLLSNFSSEIKKDFANKQVSDYISIACRSVLNPSFKKELTNLFRNLNQCRDPKQKSFFYTDFKELEFACSNDGKHLTRFIKEGGIECYKKRESKIYKCIEDVIFTQLKVKDIDTLVADTAKFCKSITMSKKCVTEELRHCLSTSSVKFLDGFLNSYNIPICTKA